MENTIVALPSKDPARYESGVQMLRVLRKHARARSNAHSVECPDMHNKLRILDSGTQVF